MPKKKFKFEMIVVNDEKLIISLYDLKDGGTIYEDEFDYESISKVFGVLPDPVQSELVSVVSYQVFICGIVNKKKAEVHLSRNDRIRLELIDIAKAPKGAVYNVSLFLTKV